MPVSVTFDQIGRLAPRIHPGYRDAFADGQAVLDHYGISESTLRVAHFFAQILHESAGLTVQFENLDYSAGRLSVVWPSRFRPAGPLDPARYAHNQQRLANAVYGGRMGNLGPGDGYTFRGRGLLQLTGRDSYAEATALLRLSFPEAPDFTRDPELVLSPAWCLHVAASAWLARDCNRLADQDALPELTIRINGGLIGLPERLAWFKRTRLVWC
jgi:putative chitinase